MSKNVPKTGLKQEGADMDRQNLRRRGDSGVWMLDFVFPDDYPVPRLRGYRWRRSTGTHDLSTARAIRDRVLGDVRRARDETQILRDLIKLHSDTVEHSKNLITGELAAALGLKTHRPYTLGDLAAEHLKSAENDTGRHQKTAGTLQRRKDVLATVCLIAGADTPLGQLDAESVFETISRLSRGWQVHKGKGLAFCLEWSGGAGRSRLSPNTIREHWMHFGTAWRWALENDKTDIPFPRAKGRLKILIAGQDQKGRGIPGIEDCERLCNLPCPRCWDDVESWQAAPMIARYTGFRLAEVAQLTGESLRTINGITCLALPESGQFKTSESLRAVPVADKILGLVERLAAKSGKTGLLVRLGETTSGEGRTQQGAPYARLFARAAKSVGGFSFHSFRGYANSQMADAGVPDTVRREILGHKEKNDMQRHYLSAVSTRHFEAVNKIP